MLLTFACIAMVAADPAVASADPLPATPPEYVSVIGAASSASRELERISSVGGLLHRPLQDVADWYAAQDPSSQWLLAVEVAARAHRMDDVLDVGSVRNSVENILSRFTTDAARAEQLQSRQPGWSLPADRLELLDPDVVPDSHSPAVVSLSTMVGLYERLDWALGVLAAEVAQVEQVPADVLHAAWRATSFTRLRVLFAALEKLGVPYRANADGPDAYDCSGFTTAVWQEVGVSLPSYSAYQQQVTTPVSEGALQPADLVFYKPLWTPSRNAYIGHVSMYLGASQMVIESTGAGVSISQYRAPRISGFGAVAAPE
jgi:cell wall-associated NlpC family hydrolase